MGTVTTSRLPRSAASTGARIDFSSLISTKGPGLPNRYVLYANEKWGKSSLAAQFPGVIFLQTRGETGLETLIDAGQLPEIPHFPEIKDWGSLTAAIAWLREAEHNYRSLAIDTINGAERLLHEMVCARDYQNEWGDRGFGAYQKGYEVSLADLNLMLSSLDALRLERRMTIILLAHRKINTVKNPAGADFDTFQPDLHKSSWGTIAKWSDVILYGDTEVIVQTEGKSKKGKGISQSRIIRCAGSPAWVAGNRIGLPDEIEAGDSPQEAWQNFAAAVKAARNQKEVSQ
jgi:hypothetical protein